jgi:hypothetical protein
MHQRKQTYEAVHVAWHFDTLNEDARDALREAQALLDVSDVTHDSVRQVLSRIARRLPAHSVEAVVDEGDGTHVLHRVRAGDLEDPVMLHACDPRGRPLALAGDWRTIDFGADVPEDVLAAIEAAEHATGWLIDREVEGGVLRISPELPDERVLARVVDAIVVGRWDVADQLEGLWRVADTEGLDQVSVRIVDGKTRVEPVRLRTAEGENDAAATLLRWTYENAERVPPRGPSLSSSEGEALASAALASATLSRPGLAP